MDKKNFSKEETDSKKTIYIAIFNVDFHKNSAEKVLKYFLSLDDIFGINGIHLFEKKDKKNFVDSQFNLLGILEVENKKMGNIIYESFDGAEVDEIKFDLRFIEKDLLTDLNLIKKIKSSEISFGKNTKERENKTIKEFQPNLNDERFKLFYTDNKYKIDRGTIMYKNNRAIENFAKEWERRNFN